MVKVRKVGPETSFFGGGSGVVMLRGLTPSDQKSPKPSGKNQSFQKQIEKEAKEQMSSSPTGAGPEDSKNK